MVRQNPGPTFGMVPTASPIDVAFTPVVLVAPSFGIDHNIASLRVVVHHKPLHHRLLGLWHSVLQKLRSMTRLIWRPSCHSELLVSRSRCLPCGTKCPVLNKTVSSVLPVIFAHPGSTRPVVSWYSEIDACRSSTYLRRTPCHLLLPPQ